MSTAPERFDPFVVGLEGSHVVDASAGTGKTYAITTVLVRLIVEQSVPIDEILVVTFTEAATSELRGRVRSRLRAACEAFKAVAAGLPATAENADLHHYAEQRLTQSRSRGSRDLDRLQTALTNIDQAAISTIHGFCFRILRQCAFETGVPFDCEMATHLGALTGQVLDDYWCNSLFALPLATARRLLSGPHATSRQQLRPLLDKALRNPDLVILPQRPQAIEHPSDLEAEAAYLRARAKWNHDEVRRLLEKDRALTGARPGPNQRRNWCRAVEVYYADASQLWSPPDAFRKLTTSSLSAKTGAAPSHPYFDAVEDLIDVLDRGAAADAADALEFKKRLLDRGRLEFAKQKRNAGQLSFDDLLQLLGAALRSPQGPRLAAVIRRQFRAALIDEFQDTDPVQFSIFNEVFGTTRAPFFMIGDPKQAIYAFRGADVFAYLQALRESSAQRLSMTVNWRSDPRLLDAINAVFSSPRLGAHAFLLEGIDYTPVEPRPDAKDVFEGREEFATAPLEFLLFPRTSAEGKLDDKIPLRDRVPALIAHDIARLLGSNSRVRGCPVAAKDVAILTRTNRQCFEIQDALRERGIAAVVLGDQSVFSAPEAEELLLILSAVLEPTSSHHLRRALATDLLGLDAAALLALESNATDWDIWSTRFRNWNSVWTDRGFIQMFSNLLEDTRSTERLLTLVDGERRVTNWLHLMELLHIKARESHLGPTALYHWLGQERANAEKRLVTTAEHTEIRLESDASAVKLTTIHKSKGLEFPIVYLPYLWDGKLLFPGDKKFPLFHDPADGYRLTLDIGGPNLERGQEQAETEALAENIRLLYVALTRAKHRCTVLWGAVKEMGSSALALLLDPPAPPLDIPSLNKRYKQLSDEDLIAPIRDLCLRAAGAVAARVLSPSPPANRLEAPRGVEQISEARVPFRTLSPFWRTASFSSLTHATASLGRAQSSGAPSALVSPDLAIARDHDELAPAPAQARSARGDSTRPLTLAEFPRGAKAGTCVHDLLERYDFQAPEQLSAHVDNALRTHGIALEPHAASLHQAILEVTTTPLGGPCKGLTLSDIPKHRRREELEFQLPVEEPGRHQELTAQRLAEVFRSGRGELIPDTYPAAVAGLGFLPLQGYLKGFIDLVFEHEGRLYLIDYKTNYLGADPQDYDARAMSEAMEHSHYFLQYHLYAVAVTRLLALRQPRYSYEQHFGGVYYLFLRGMHPDTGPELGVYFEKPPEQRLQLLDALFCAPGAS